MLTWIIVGGYVIGFVYTWRDIGGRILSTGDPDDADIDEYIFVATISMFFSLVWVVCLPCLITYDMYQRHKELVLPVLPYLFKAPKETKEQERARLQARIKELEEDTGINEHV